MNRKYTGGESPWNWSHYFFGQKEHSSRPTFFPIAVFIISILLNVLPWFFQSGKDQRTPAVHFYVIMGLQVIAMILFLLGTHHITEANARYLLDTSNISMITLNKQVQEGKITDEEAQEKKQLIYHAMSLFSKLDSKNKLSLVLNFSSTLTMAVNAAIFCAYYRTLMPSAIFAILPALLLVHELVLFFENLYGLATAAKCDF